MTKYINFQINSPIGHDAKCMKSSEEKMYVDTGTWGWKDYKMTAKQMTEELYQRV